MRDWLIAYVVDPPRHCVPPLQRGSTSGFEVKRDLLQSSNATQPGKIPSGGVPAGWGGSVSHATQRF
ncbi:MAG: hypothetical protein AAFY33_15600 [Cyanobacteria bacterium J06643_4]